MSRAHQNVRTKGNIADMYSVARNVNGPSTGIGTYNVAAKFFDTHEEALERLCTISG